ncbi:MAG TPA: VWA domain-containing protein [Thermoanaerobaculia bacterium]|nr:VWA domain-containing protein [Thermoanaerobaculia bacterium]
MTRRFGRSLCLLSCLFLPILNFDILHAAEGPGKDRLRPWLEEVDPLITSREREVFLGLGDEAERKAFIQRFWQVRDPYPQTPRNEAAEVWQRRVAEAETRWGSVRDDRARVFLLQGEPSSSFEARCGGVGFEVWSYGPRFQVAYRTLIVFVKDDAGTVRLWHPAPGFPGLPTADQCADGKQAQMADATKWVRQLGKGGYDVVLARALTKPKPREWLSSFSSLPLETPAGAQDLGAGLRVELPGREVETGRGIARVLIALPAGLLPEGGTEDHPHELLVSGVIERDGTRVESYRYRFEVSPRQAVANGSSLAFERALAPGSYRVRLKLEHPASGTVFAGEREVSVPDGRSAAPAQVASVPTPSSTGVDPEPTPADVSRVFSEADATLSAARPGLRLLSPSGALLAGNVRFEARISRVAGAPDGEQIDRVAFSLDGKPLLTRNRPPFLVQVDLGATPRLHKLRAEGLNSKGEVLASDELLVNAGAQRFAVKLVEPRPGRTYRRSLRARAEVEVPDGNKVERMELFLGEKRVATLYQAPWSHPLALPGTGEIAYVRAVAYLSDGSTAEDLVLLNAPQQPDAIDVRLVELYTTVADGKGRPVEGLDPSTFRVLEDGVPQTIRRAEWVAETPVRIVTLIDNSASMQPRLESTRQAALEFLHRVLRPQDQAAVITFNNAPRVVVGLTGNLAALEEGLSGLVARDETALYDSVIYSLYYLTGAKGQRAVLVLSDGLDRSSDFRYEDALESARRSGIAVYTIGLDLPDGHRGDAARKLSRLAEATGGRSFFVKGTGELASVYTEIERELRSQYRLVYQSTNSSSVETFRAVRVEVGKPGMEARTISGYYP